MTIDSTRRLQSLYVPVSDGVRLAVDVWLPVEHIAAGERVSTAFRATRYHRAEQPPSPGPEADSNRAAGELWSNGRVGVYGTSYEGQAAELVAGLGNPHVVAVAALFSPLYPYRELFYPGGCGTDGRFARWMYESQLKDGVAGALGRLAAITGQPAEAI